MKGFLKFWVPWVQQAGGWESKSTRAQHQLGTTQCCIEVLCWYTGGCHIIFPRQSRVKHAFYPHTSHVVAYKADLRCTVSVVVLAAAGPVQCWWPRWCSRDSVTGAGAGDMSGHVWWRPGLNPDHVMVRLSAFHPPLRVRMWVVLWVQAKPVASFEVFMGKNNCLFWSLSFQWRIKEFQIHSLEVSV